MGDEELETILMSTDFDEYTRLSHIHVKHHTEEEEK